MRSKLILWIAEIELSPRKGMIASNNQSQQNKSINFDQTIGSCSNFAFRFYKPDLRGGHLTITK
jgi:hypothetical protein